MSVADIPRLAEELPAGETCRVAPGLLSRVPGDPDGEDVRASLELPLEDLVADRVRRVEERVEVARVQREAGRDLVPQPERDGGRVGIGDGRRERLRAG